MISISDSIRGGGKGTFIATICPPSPPPPAPLLLLVYLDWRMEGGGRSRSSRPLASRSLPAISISAGLRLSPGNQSTISNYFVNYATTAIKARFMTLSDCQTIDKSSQVWLRASTDNRSITSSTISSVAGCRASSQSNNH